MGISAENRAKRPTGRPLRRAFICFLIAAAAYALLCAAVYCYQDNIVFMRQKLLDESVAAAASADGAEEIELAMKDGTRLRGWVVRNAPGDKSPLLIYFGANAEEVSHLIPIVSRLEGWTVALVNYRGYGASEGTPGEKAVKGDALEIYDSFASRDDIGRGRIAVMGRSIGTGVAAYLAANRPVSSVVLVSPYETLVDVAKEKFPFLPVEQLCRYRFDSLSLAPAIDAPLLVIAGSDDTLIPERHSRKLADAWGGPVVFEEIAGTGHNTVDDAAEYWKIIEQFLDKQG